jgi:hypothetical protein
VVLAVALFATRGPRTTPGALALAALVVSWLFYIWMIPDNWYGGGGTVGNRYFLNLVPLAFLLVPRGREWVVVGVGAAASAAFLWPLWRAPLYHSMHPGAHATRPPFTWLPAELTMLNDLSVFTEGWRKKRPYRDTEGDPGRGRRADPDAYFLYFTGDGTYGKDILQAREGFWLRGGRAGEIVLRSLEPLTGIDVGVYGGAAGDEVTIEADGEERRLSVGPGQWARAELAVRSPGFQYYDSFVSVLRFRSRRGSAPPPEAGVPADRVVGGFVELRLRVAHRGGGER